MVYQPTGCWIWGGRKFENGYGRFYIGCISVKAHRISYVLFNRKIVRDKLVCHSCDTPICVNPEHLWLGTHKENTQDCIKKGRRNPQLGENNHAAKLNNLAISYIRNNSDISSKELAKKFNVSEVAIYLVRKGKTWTHI